MKSLYITADKIGTPTGGGAVTYHESEALKEISDCTVWNRDSILSLQDKFRLDLIDPWMYDDLLYYQLTNTNLHYDLVHLYSGTFSRSVAHLKSNGAKIAYTCAAHNVQISRIEHESLGLDYNYPHLTHPELWSNYIKGYSLADIVVTPSSHSEEIAHSYGWKQTQVIPHGTDVPKEIHKLPRIFTVGYLGAIGPDKGLIYLVKAWKELAYPDAILKIAGSQSTSPFMRQLVNTFGGGNIQLCGWVDKIADFYNDISIYVQPSCSEGFGIEVLESIAHGRRVLCSDGTGAKDLVESDYVFPIRDVNILAQLIDNCKNNPTTPEQAEALQEQSKHYTWDRIRKAYQILWRTLCAPSS